MKISGKAKSMSQVSVFSEFGTLEGVIVHTPGAEVEKMTPLSAKRALYSDILNLSVAREEYSLFKGVLSRFSPVYEVKDLLTAVLDNKKVKRQLLSKICDSEGTPYLFDYLLSQSADETTRLLLEGVDITRDNLTRFLSAERYSLAPLHNFFFTRDASMSIFDNVLIAKMANSIRFRESMIMDAIFRHHPLFSVETVNPSETVHSNLLPQLTIEGGDVLVLCDHVLLVGTGSRTSTHGVDFIIEELKKRKLPQQFIIVQELPHSPESFIHLDMVFTVLDQEHCMIYKPLILGQNRYRTILISIAYDKVESISIEQNIPEALEKIGYHFNMVYCGGGDDWNQEREQWHSGANFFALSPGIVVGYERNVHTIEELSKHGFDVVTAKNIIENRVGLPTSKTVITIPGAELARGGGGARCMSMPVKRKRVDW